MKLPWSKTPLEPDGYLLAADDDAELQGLLSDYLRQAVPASDRMRFQALQPQAVVAGKSILQSNTERQVASLRAASLRLRWNWEKTPNVYPKSLWPDALAKLIGALFRLGLPLLEADYDRLLTTGMWKKGTILTTLPLDDVIDGVELSFTSSPLPPRLRDWLRSRRYDLATRPNLECERAVIRIDVLLGVVEPNLPQCGEPWGDAVMGDLAAMPDNVREAWRVLFAHILAIGSLKASGKWHKESSRLLDDIGRSEAGILLTKWMQLVQPSNETMGIRKSDLLVGFVRCSRFFPDERLPLVLGALAQICYKKVPGLGPASLRVANECVHVLSTLDGLGSMAELSRLRLVTKYRPALVDIEKAMQACARKMNQPPEELEELAVPDYGMSEPGCLRAEVSGFRVQIAFDDKGTGVWKWTGPGGRETAAIPAAVKRDYAGQLKELKQIVTNIGKMLPAQRERMERLLRSERQWPLQLWRKRYLDHPLLAGMARRLIWHFRDDQRNALGMWNAGDLVDVDGNPLGWVGDSTMVRLWHPLGSEPDRVLCWRRRLEETGTVQPFKQAHREVYILTAAELSTEMYSNRFAGHVLKQHQLNALCQQRGWRYQLHFGDSNHDAILNLPNWNMACRYFVEPVMGPMSEAGIWLYVTTDQVRFLDTSGEQVPLAEVPALIFSEVMRDVDLFVGVASIGNDPGWQDRGEDNRYGAYWRGYAFGDLNASAQTRRDLLERLMPKLKIAGRCSLDGKFLVVQGDLRTYKIHLGSGNILMEPNSQYLCIVPDRGGKAVLDKLFLPFEGDQMLSVILSKAFLLAADTKIKDASIVGQIRRYGG